MRAFRFPTYLAPLASALLLSEMAFGQGNPSSNAAALPIQVSPTDEAAAASGSSLGIHAVALAGSKSRPMWSNALQSSSSLPIPVAGALIPSIAEVPPPGFYPEDVSNPTNGPTVLTAASHPLYVNCADTC